MAGSRCVDGVSVSTELDRDGKSGQNIACKQKLRVEKCVELAAHGLLAALIIGRGKQSAAGLGAGDKTQKLTVGHDGRNAVQRTASRSVGQTDDNEHVASGAGLDNSLERSFRAA